MKRGTRTYVGPSQIHGNGLFAGEDLSQEGGFFGTTHENNWPTTDLGRNYNHSDTPNARVTKIGNKHFIMPIGTIKAGEEITVDYRNQPELEQPQEGWKCGGKVSMSKGGSLNFQNGGKIKPKITFTKEDLDYYQSNYTGEVPFMDQLFNEYRDMNYFPVLNQDGTLSAYEVADISEGIMEHGYRGQQLSKILGADRTRIDEMFQPVYDYHQAKYDERGMRKIQELMNAGMTKQGAFDLLVSQKFGTQEGLERIFGQRANSITSQKLQAERAARDLLERQKFEEEQRAYEEDPHGYKAYEEYKKQQEQFHAQQISGALKSSEQTGEQLMQQAYSMGPTVEGAELLKKARALMEREKQQKETDYFTGQEIQYNNLQQDSESTRVVGLDTQRGDFLGKFELKTPQQMQAEAEEFTRRAMNEYYRNRVLYEDELGLKREDFINPATGDYDDAALAQAMFAPEMQQRKIENFKQTEQAAWDALPWYEKAGKSVVAFLDDPVLTGANWMEGKGPMLGQWDWLSDEGKAQELANRFGITTEDLYEMSGENDSYANDILKFFNPLHYSVQAGSDLREASDLIEQGEYWEGAKELGSAGLNFATAYLGGKPLVGGSTLPGVASAEQLGVKQVFKGEASVTDLFKRKDLVRITGQESLDELKTKIANGLRPDPSDAMWQQALRNNPELKQYVAQFGDDALYRVTPLTEAAASQYRLPNLVSAMESGTLPQGISREAVVDAATKSIPSKIQVARDPVLRQHFFSQPLETRMKMNQMMSQPEGYWKTGMWQSDLGLQQAMKNPLFVQTEEYLLPRATSGYTSLGGQSIENISAGSLLGKPIIEAEKKAARQALERSGTAAAADETNTSEPNPGMEQQISEGSVNVTPTVQTAGPAPTDRGLMNYMQMSKMFGGVNFR